MKNITKNNVTPEVGIEISRRRSSNDGNYDVTLGLR